jgi:hypothetical protein
MANVLPLAKTTRASKAPSWRETLSRATSEAERLLPKQLQGAAVGESTLDKARGVLERIKRALRFAEDPRTHTPEDAAARARPGVLRRAAGVIAKGAADAARFAGQVKDDIASDLRKLASDAWSVAQAPLILGGLVWMLLSDKRGSQEPDPLLVAGALYLASRVL